MELEEGEGEFFSEATHRAVTARLAKKKTRKINYCAKLLTYSNFLGMVAVGWILYMHGYKEVFMEGSPPTFLSYAASERVLWSCVGAGVLELIGFFSLNHDVTSVIFAIIYLFAVTRGLYDAAFVVSRITASQHDDFNQIVDFTVYFYRNITKGKVPYFIDRYQQKFECCGWGKFHWMKWSKEFNSTSVPDSCCKEYSRGCGRLNLKSSGHFRLLTVTKYEETSTANSTEKPEKSTEVSIKVTKSPIENSTETELSNITFSSSTREQATDQATDEYLQEESTTEGVTENFTDDGLLKNSTDNSISYDTEKWQSKMKVINDYWWGNFAGNKFLPTPSNFPPSYLRFIDEEFAQEFEDEPNKVDGIVVFLADENTTEGYTKLVYITQGLEETERFSSIMYDKPCETTRVTYDDYVLPDRRRGVNRTEDVKMLIELRKIIVNLHLYGIILAGVYVLMFLIFFYYFQIIKATQLAEDPVPVDFQETQVNSTSFLSTPRQYLKRNSYEHLVESETKKRLLQQKVRAILEVRYNMVAGLHEVGQSFKEDKLTQPPPPPRTQPIRDKLEANLTLPKLPEVSSKESKPKTKKGRKTK